MRQSAKSLRDVWSFNAFTIRISSVAYNFRKAPNEISISFWNRMKTK